MSDFLLELRSEEIPARMQAGARAELERLFRREMGAAGVGVGEVTVWSTPRRLALIARELPDATEAVSEEAKGPPEGAPDAALDGFCRKNGVMRDQLELRDVKGRNTWFAVVEKPGRATREVLAEAIPAIVRDFAWPKSMRWGATSISTESVRWVRPLSGIVALLGDDVVECEFAGIASGRETVGHRFHASPGKTLTRQTAGFMGTKIGGLKTLTVSRQGTISIDDVDDYERKLGMAKVIVNHSFREDEIRIGAKAAAKGAGLVLVEDEGLVVENAGLTEWPVPLLGRFDEAFLDVPPEVIQLTARVNQKYFVCEDASGKLANAFVCTANIAAEDGGAAIVDGNRKVLAARLSDARFFWDQDRKTPLAEHAKKLERITFHEKLGTVADKVERVAKLARWLVEEGIVVPATAGTGLGQGATPTAIPASAGMTKEELADLAERAARLAKADLVTEMVGEFPELQGLMGGYYARAEGLPDAVADAIRDHYKPVGQGDEVPTAPVTVAVSLADKLDTLAAFFTIDERPTGSKDPFALRRAALAVVRIVATNDLRFGLLKPLFHACADVHFRQQRSPFQRVWPAIGEYESISRKLVGRDEFFELIKEATDRANEDAARYVEEGVTDSRVLFAFFADRLKVQQREAGVRHDLIDAVFALGGEDDLVRLLARVKALQHYIETAEGADLLAGYKRAANILKKEGVVPAQAVTAVGQGANPTAIPASAGMTGDGEPEHTGEEDPLANVDDPDMRAVVEAQLSEQQGGPKKNSLSYTPEPAEEALIAALDSSEPAAARAVDAEDFGGAMAALASLRGPIDRFFDEVTVNDPDPDKRRARLDLFARFRDAVHRVADFSRIEG